MSFKNKLISLVLCGAVLLGLSGCAMGKYFGTVATVTGGEHDVELADGIFLYYQYSAYSAAVSALAEGSEVKVNYVLKQKLTEDGKEISVLDFISQKKDEYMIGHAAVDLLFEKEGLTLDSGVQKKIQEQIDGGWSYMGPVLEKNGVSLETYRILIENYYKQQALFEKYYGADHPNILSEQGIADAVKEAFMRRQVIKFPKVDADNKAITTDNKAKVLELVKQANEAIKGGMSLSDATDKYMPQVLALTTKKAYTTASDYITTEYVEYTGGAYAAAQIDLLKKGEVGSVDYYEDTRVVYCWQKQDVLTKDSLYLEKATTSESEARQSAFTAQMDEYKKDFKITYDESAQKHYSLKKIKY